MSNGRIDRFFSGVLDEVMSWVGKLLSVVFVLGLFFGLFAIVHKTKQPLPIHERIPLVDQVALCESVNLGIGVENLITAADILTIDPTDLETYFGFLVDELPKFKHSWDCWANIPKKEAGKILASREYVRYREFLDKRRSKIQRILMGAPY